MNSTGIEYLTHTWNPIAMRCSPVSDGCAHCWHLKFASRMAGNPIFSEGVRRAYGGDAPPILISERLMQPLSRRKSAVVGVQFMGDLFHEDVDRSDIARVFHAMSCSSKSVIFVVLTKRPDSMLAFFDEIVPIPNSGMLGYEVDGRFLPISHKDSYLPSNIVGLVTAENQTAFNNRVPLLLSSPFKTKGVSVEPLLSHIDIGEYDLDWVIAGGETGRNSRLMKTKWIVSLMQQCAQTRTPFFFKRWGDYDRSTLMREYRSSVLWGYSREKNGGGRSLGEFTRIEEFPNVFREEERLV